MPGSSQIALLYLETCSEKRLGLEKQVYQFSEFQFTTWAIAN